jgi:GAF domain-containing protein
LRRAAAKLLQPLRQALDGSRRLQTASQEHEAFLASQSPVIIGLISTLTDSLSREDLEKTVWRLWQRGQSVLGYQDATALKKRSKAKGKAESAQ